MIFLKLKLRFSLFGVGLGWFLGEFGEGLEKVWAGFVKVLGGLGGSWGEHGEVLEGFSTMHRLSSFDMAPAAALVAKKWKIEEGGRPDRRPFQTRFVIGLHSSSHENTFWKD